MDNGRRKELKQLGTAGKQLWAWLREKTEGTEDSAPGVEKLCKLQDLMHQLEDAIAQQGVTIDGKKNPLLDTYIKFYASWWKAWSKLGMSDKPDAVRRPVGRPPESERIRQWRA